MFGWFKRRVARRMNNLVRTAQMTIGVGLIQHYGFADTVSDSEKDAVAKRGSAAANFLNGQPPHETHAGLDLQQIYAEASQWMQDNPTMRELVVQTLRVSWVVDYMVKRGDLPSEERMSILTKFGSEFPNAPDPNSYEALVRRAIGTLPVSSQARVLGLMETGL